MKYFITKVALKKDLPGSDDKLENIDFILVLQMHLGIGSLGKKTEQNLAPEI